MQGLCTAEYCRKCLDGYPGNIVYWLLGRQRTATGLYMKSKHHCFRVGSAQILHNIRPHTTCGPEFSRLLKQIIMCIKEKGKPLAKFINVEPFFNGCFNISLAVSQGKCDFLN